MAQKSKYRRKPAQSFLQVVADTGGCAILEKVLRGAAEWAADSGHTSSYVDKLFEVLISEQIWKMGETHFMHSGCVCMPFILIYLVLSHSTGGAPPCTHHEAVNLLPSLKYEEKLSLNRCGRSLCGCCVSDLSH